MRRLLPLLLALAVSGAMAQARPPNLEPLPEAPPPPPIPGPNEPSVRIPVQQGDKVEEMRDGGRVVAIKVTPPGGKPYYLIDQAGNGNWVRQESLGPGLSVPMWQIHKFD
jgi:hypothetical protein